MFNASSRSPFVAGHHLWKKKKYIVWLFKKNVNTCTLDNTCFWSSTFWNISCDKSGDSFCAQNTDEVLHFLKRTSLGWDGQRSALISQQSYFLLTITGCLFMSLFFCETVFLWSFFLLNSFSCGFVFLWGCLPVRSFLCKVFFL